MNGPSSIAVVNDARLYLTGFKDRLQRIEKFSSELDSDCFIELRNLGEEWASLEGRVRALEKLTGPKKKAKAKA